MSLKQIADRRESYLVDHQVTLHITLVSVALGVSGIAAASLVAGDRDRPDAPVMWLLWAVSSIGIGTVYAGVTSSAFLLPVTFPGLLDLFIPLGLGLTEFLLFAVLTPSLTRISSVRSEVDIWFVCFAVFSGLASAAIRRARFVLDCGHYDGVMAPIVKKQHDRMGRDVLGSTIAFLVATGSAGILRWVPKAPLWLGYVFASIAAILLLAGLVNHRNSSHALSEDLFSAESAGTN